MSTLHQAPNASAAGIANNSGLYSGQHISGQNIVDQSIHTHYCTSPGLYAGIEILLGASEPNAAVDADARAYAPRCFPGTREQYIDDITCWATASCDDQPVLIYHMKGPAGVGKSAIAQTCAERVKKRGKLGAAFFFSVNGCNNHRRFFTTIAYQLSTILPEYKRILNDRIINDRTIVSKTITSQLEELIIGPLWEMKELGREMEMMTIFVDGLDECQSPNAQSEIIELIAASVRDHTTPFRWVFFSRAEIHIEATFNLDFIIPLNRTVELPISREADQEIKLYLEGGFQNILRRQHLSLSRPWPPPEAIQKLVDASAGLYAYPAAVLRFIDSSPTEGPKEALAIVLDIISQSDSCLDSLSPFTELDSFYMYIMEHIPDHILPSVQLFLSNISNYDHDRDWCIARMFNTLRLSEAVLNGIRKHLHAVLYFRQQGSLQLGADIDVTCPWYTQRHPSHEEEVAIRSSLGNLSFYHKSFYDFLIDPARSSAFCVFTLELKVQVFERGLQTHFDLEKCFKVYGTEPMLECVSADGLSFPLQNEYSNSYMQNWLYWGNFLVFFQTMFPRIHSARIPHDLLQKISEVDYQKYLLHTRWPCLLPLGLLDLSNDHAIRRCMKSDFSYLQGGRFPMELLSAIKLLKKFGVIKPYHATFASRLKRFFQAKLSRSVQTGLYTVGQGEKAVFWYWEVDMESKKFYEFWTLDLLGTMEFFQANKYEMWSDDWTPPSSRDPSEASSSISSDGESRQSVSSTHSRDK